MMFRATIRKRKTGFGYSYYITIPAWARKEMERHTLELVGKEVRVEVTL